MKWLKGNLSWIKWIAAIIYSIMLAMGSGYLSYQKMKWDIDDIKKDMEAVNIIELKAKVDMILTSTEDIKDQFNIVVKHLLNNP